MSILPAVFGFLRSDSPPLLTDLISYYSFSSTIDSHRSNNLTNNGVTFSAGKIGNAANFNAANSEYLSVSSSQLSFTGDFTFSVWCNTNDVTGSAEWIFSKDNVASSREYQIMVLNSEYYFQVWNGATRYFINRPATSGVWQHLMMWYDSGAGMLYASLNNGTAASRAVPDINNTSTPFLVGVRGDFFGYYSGSIDELGLWKRLLTPAERTQLYNSGAGLTYPFV